MKELPIELQSAKEFHSHLGPYLVVGLKMGRFLTEEMDTSPLRITSYTGSTPPVSCLIDGLQLSTPCTVGNGGISIREQGEARVEGKGEGRKITLTLPVSGSTLALHPASRIPKASPSIVNILESWAKDIPIPRGWGRLLSVTRRWRPLLPIPSVLRRVHPEATFWSQTSCPASTPSS